MAFTIVAYSENKASNGSLVYIAPVSDQHLTTSGNDVLVPAFANKLAFVYGIAPNITEVQVTSPSLRENLLVDVSDLDVGTEPATPTNIYSLLPKGRELVEGEGLRVKVADADGGTAQRKTVIVGLFDKIDALPDKEILTVKCTSNTTLTAYEWTLGKLTFTQQLEAGTYAIVGMKAISDGLIAARLVIPGSARRPGVVGCDSVGDKIPDIFRMGKLGVWGTFEHTFPPQVEFLSSSADTSEIVYLDLIKMD